jgi:hypothetical protein
MRHCTTSRKVAVSIPDDLILPVALQPLTEMITSNISWEVKVAGAQG